MMSEGFIATAASNAPNAADWISASAGVLTFVIALIALLYAKGQLKEASLARQQSKDLESERSQPYVVVYTEQAAVPEILNIVIKNYGQTAAYDVKVEIDPWPKRANGEVVKLPERIPFLAPGQDWQTMWDVSGDRLKSDLPEKHDARVTYKGLDEKPLATRAILDWGIYRSKIYMVTYGMHDLVRAAREMNKNQKKWTDGQTGLRVFTRDGDAKDSRLVAKAKAFRERHVDSQKSRTAAQDKSREEDTD